MIIVSGLPLYRGFTVSTGQRRSLATGTTGRVQKLVLDPTVRPDPGCAMRTQFKNTEWPHPTHGLALMTTSAISGYSRLTEVVGESMGPSLKQNVRSPNLGPPYGASAMPSLFKFLSSQGRSNDIWLSLGRGQLKCYLSSFLT